MNRSYQELIERCGEPLWWDDQAVPRYQPFAPGLCGVYDTWVALCAIRCQDCHQPFLVAVAHSMLELVSAELLLPDGQYTNGFHYGDPPCHGCVGDTMNVETMRILEVWEKRIGGRPMVEWVRHPECEFVYLEGGAWA